MLDLKARFGKSYHVVAEASAETPGQTAEERLWLWTIPGKRGHIFLWGRDELAATTDAPSRRRALLALPGVRVRQRGDREVTVSFNPALTEQVAQILGCRRRRKLTTEHRRKLVEAGSGHRFGPGSNAPIPGQIRAQTDRDAPGAIPGPQSPGAPGGPSLAGA
jgi:hypothetical protein